MPWETPVALAAGHRARRWPPCRPATVLNLNVPAVAPDRLRGLRHGALGTVGPDPVGPSRAHARSRSAGTPIDRTAGAITLTLRGMGAAADRLAEQAELEPDSDAALIADGWATLTPLLGVREDVSGAGRGRPRRRPGHLSRRPGSEPCALPPVRPGRPWDAEGRRCSGPRSRAGVLAK